MRVREMQRRGLINLKTNEKRSRLYRMHPVITELRLLKFSSNLANAPVGGSDFACMFWRFLMMTWALSLVPIMAMSVRILFTSYDRC